VLFVVRRRWSGGAGHSGPPSTRRPSACPAANSSIPPADNVPSRTGSPSPPPRPRPGTTTPRRPSRVSAA